MSGRWQTRKKKIVDPHGSATNQLVMDEWMSTNECYQIKVKQTSRRDRLYYCCCCCFFPNVFFIQTRWRVKSKVRLSIQCFYKMFNLLSCPLRCHWSFLCVCVGSMCLRLTTTTTLLSHRFQDGFIFTYMSKHIESIRTLTKQSCPFTVSLVVLVGSTVVRYSLSTSLRFPIPMSTDRCVHPFVCWRFSFADHLIYTITCGQRSTTTAV